MYHLPNDVRIGFTSLELSSKHLTFRIKLPNISIDGKLSKHYIFMLVFSQDIFYKLNFRKFISKLLKN